MAFLNLNIRGRLILGFSVLCALLAIVVGTTIVKVSAVNEATNRTVNLRVPTAMTASDVVAGVYASLASLRGWLITGNDVFKVERATLWKEMQGYGAKMDGTAIDTTMTVSTIRSTTTVPSTVVRLMPSPSPRAWLRTSSPRRAGRMLFARYPMYV